jgi:hypothetical protein
LVAVHRDPWQGCYFAREAAHSRWHGRKNMSDRIASQDSDPRNHSRKIREMLEGTRQHMREDVGKITDPKAQALFETSAEVISGLIAAYQHYEQRSEAAWR